MTQDSRVRDFVAAFEGLRAEVEKVIVGHRDIINHVLIGMFAGGHVLLEGVPGLGKTLLIKTLAEGLELSFSRIQFTPDLMPADIIGTNIIVEDPDGRKHFQFQPGPVFGHILLADEINRATPKTQSALLEAMQERSVTVRGKNHVLAPPFLVLATQNPIELEGTYPLPEAQLDRFLFNVILDYLSGDDELAVVNRFTTRVDMPEVGVCTNAEQILNYQWLVRQVPVSESVNRYAVNLVRATRPKDETATDMVKRYVNFGASVRATMFLTLAAKAHALLQGRYHVTQDDIRAVSLPILRHRVLTNYHAESDGTSVDMVLGSLLDTVKT